MEAPPAPPQPLPPQAQQLPSPCESPKPVHDCLETSDLCGPTDKLEFSGDCIPAGEDLNTPGSLLQLIAPVEETLRTESSLFVDDNAMEDSQAADDIFATEKNYALENHYAMEGIYAVEKDQQIPHVPEAEVDSEEDNLPSTEKIFDEKIAMTPPKEFECDGNGVTDEDEGSEYEDDSNFSSDSDYEHEVPQANSASVTEKESKRPRRKIALTAREYVARLHEEEDRKYARKKKQEEGKKPGAKRSRKRKLVEGNAGSSKALKTANGSSFLISNDCSSSSNDHQLLPMEPIKARTHAEQFAQLTASIPQNCDTRRKTTQSQDLKEAASLFGYKKVEAQNGNWKLKGMETAMRCHQITAVAWMVKRELARMEPFGGILADAMGMGKTIMSLACIIGNPPDDEHINKFCKATLVVVPSKTIALQWEEEARVGIWKLPWRIENSKLTDYTEAL
jgi:SNF2 family DNA or RNA helicase